MARAINFKKLFKDAHIKTRDDPSRHWTHINCPFCKNPVDTHFNGGFFSLKPAFNCFRCGVHSYYDAVSLALNISIGETYKLLKSYEYIPKETFEKKVAKAEHLDLPGYHLDENEKEYLRGRGFNVEYLESKFHIRGGGIAGDWSYRILIPIYFNHVLVSWTGRSILPKDVIEELGIPRYKNLSIEQSVINSKEIFFNLDNCNGKEVILVEGPMDVLRGNDNCICSLGTSVTREQELFLKNRFEKVFIAFDNEPAAQEKAKHLGMNLSSIGMSVEVVNICEDFYKDVWDEDLKEFVKIQKNDPGELTEDEMNKVKKELGLL